jgi:hydrogenase expression/formation protein HypC
MCLGIPMQVIRVDGADGHSVVCCGRNGVERIDTLRTGPLEVGQWVLCSLGAAREVIDALRAAQIDAALDALTAVLSGEGDPDEMTALIDHHFSDLVNREPQLPEFLRPTMEVKP